MKLDCEVCEKPSASVREVEFEKESHGKFFLRLCGHCMVWMKDVLP